ncbi:hypothetical protein D3C85_1904260 [compost metagenome]
MLHITIDLAKLVFELVHEIFGGFACAVLHDQTAGCDGQLDFMNPREDEVLMVTDLRVQELRLMSLILRQLC